MPIQRFFRPTRFRPQVYGAQSSGLPVDAVNFLWDANSETALPVIMPTIQVPLQDISVPITTTVVLYTAPTGKFIYLHSMVVQPTVGGNFEYLNGATVFSRLFFGSNGILTYNNSGLPTRLPNEGSTIAISNLNAAAPTIKGFIILGLGDN